MIELKPCPFCGSENIKALYNHRVDVYTCLCIGCGTDGPMWDNEQAAIKAWNSRTWKFEMLGCYKG